MSGQNKQAKPKGLVEKITDAAKSVGGAVASALTEGDQADDMPLERAQEFAAAASDHLRHVTAQTNSAEYEAALVNLVDSFAELPGHADLCLRLADGGTFIDGAVEVQRESVAPQGDRGCYMRPIDIPPEGPPVRVTEAFLIASNGDCVRCAIPGGLSGGNGQHASIPAGHLLF